MTNHLVHFKNLLRNVYFTYFLDGLILLPSIPAEIPVSEVCVHMSR